MWVWTSTHAFPWKETITHLSLSALSLGSKSNITLTGSDTTTDINYNTINNHHHQTQIPMPINFKSHCIHHDPSYNNQFLQPLD